MRRGRTSGGSSGRRKRSGAGLSKSRLLSYRQCPRRLWLETHSPQLADPDASNEAVFAIGHAVGEIAHQVYGADGSHLVPFEPSLRAALLPNLIWHLRLQPRAALFVTDSLVRVCVLRPID